jgi:hydroxyacylglutathione hydrolase
MIAHQIRHRRGRETQILEALAEGATDVATLTRIIYADVDPRLHGAAARNVFSHLIGLVEDGRVGHEGSLSPKTSFRLR